MLYFDKIMEMNNFNIMNKEELKDFLFNALRVLHRFERVEVSEFDLNFPLIYLLKFLKRRSPLRISEISDEMIIPLFNATRLVDQLEKRALVKRERDINDKRNIYVSITRDGSKMVTKIEEFTLKTIMENIGQFEQDELIKIIDLMRNLDDILGVRMS